MQKVCTFKNYSLVTKQGTKEGGEREMAKKSMTPSERREAILKVLCQRRQDKIDNLAFEFGVSVRTIKNDIEELSRLSD